MNVSTPTTTLDLRWTVSNGLSALRGVMAIPLAIFIAGGMRTAAIILSVVAMITDVADGYIARRFNEISDLGKIVDPLSDKIYVAVGVLAMLAQGWLPVWFVALVLGRDLLIFLGGIWVERRTGMVLPSNYWGKGAVVSLALTALVVLGAAGQEVIAAFMALTVVLLAISFILYLVRAVKVVRGG